MTDPEVQPLSKEKARGWVYVPRPDLSGVGLAWHYTDASGFLGIINNHGLWASAATSLNDTSEVRYGADVIHRTWELVREELPSPRREYVDTVLNVDLTSDMLDNVFVLSGSLDGDLLNQWHHYAHRGGFALGLDWRSGFTLRASPDRVADGRRATVLPPLGTGLSIKLRSKRSGLRRC